MPEELSQQLIRAYDSLLLNKNNALDSLALIKRLLIGASIGGNDSELGKQFISSQDHFELNASLVLLTSISQISTQLITDKQQPSTALINQLSSSFILLQGLLHLHPQSQDLFKSEYNLRILLKFLPLALHSAAYSSIGLPLLDLLLMTFVDSPTNAQLFESAGGLEILVQAMKQKSLKTELRVKVLEALWAWWIDEDEPPPDTHPILPHINHPSQSPPNLDSALPNRIPPNHQDLPKSSSANDHHETPSNKSRANSRIRPISLPPPSLSEEDELANTSGNLSDGHETPKANKPAPKVRIQPSSTTKPISRSQSSLSQQPPSSHSSPMVKSSSEGSNISATPLRASKSSDPASRLRMMLENTAGQFVPATPHHPHRTRPAATATTTPRDRSSSPSRAAPLHKSHPVSLVKNSSDSDDQQRTSGGRPSESSEDSDRINLSPNKLFGVRQRRTAIKPASNTPQRLIRHKQSASLGSIQHQLQLPTKAHSQSSEDEGMSGSGSAGSEREGAQRARDPTRRPIRSSATFTPEPMAATDTPRRPSSRLTQATTPHIIPSSERKRLSCDTPRATRPSAKTPSRHSGHLKLTPQRPASPAKPGSSSSSHDELIVEQTPRRALSPIKLSSSRASASMTTTNKTLITPVTPTSSKHNNLIVAGKLNPSSTPNKKFISKPLSPVHARIYQSDLESIVNATDSDVRPNPALFSHKKDKSKHRRSVGVKKSTPTTTPPDDDDDGDDDDYACDDKPLPTTPKQDENEDQLRSPPPARPLVGPTPDVLKQSVGTPQHQQRKQKKTGILEKYMANSDELVRSFREIGVGFKALSRHHHHHHHHVGDGRRRSVGGGRAGGDDEEPEIVDRPSAKDSQPLPQQQLVPRAQNFQPLVAPNSGDLKKHHHHKIIIKEKIRAVKGPGRTEKFLPPRA